MSSRSETSDDYVLVNSEDGGVGELPTPAEAKDATNETVKFDAGSDAANVVDSGEKAHDDVKDGSQHSEKDGKDDGRKEATSDCQDNVTDRDEKVDAEKVEIEVKDDSKKTENEGINEDDDLEVKYQHLLKLVDQMKVDNDRLNEKLSDLRSKALTDRRADEEKEILYNESLIWREKLEKGLEYYKDKCKRLEEKYQRDMSSVSGNHAAAEKRLRQNTNDHRDEVAQLKKKYTNDMKSIKGNLKASDRRFKELLNSDTPEANAWRDKYNRDMRSMKGQLRAMRERYEEQLEELEDDDSDW